MASSISLSLASNSCVCAVNTLPITAIATAITPVSAKYSHPSPASSSGPQSCTAIMKNRKKKQTAT